MWKLGLRPHNFFIGNICFVFSVICLCSVKACSLKQNILPCRKTAANPGGSGEAGAGAEEAAGGHQAGTGEAGGGEEEAGTAPAPAAPAVPETGNLPTTALPKNVFAFSLNFLHQSTEL